MSGLKGVNYFGNHVGAPQILQGTPNYNVEVSEGMNPPGEFYPAFYLPTVESENRLQGSAFVLMPGKVVAFDKDARNRNGRLITAGLALDYKTFAAAEGSVPATGVTSIRYGQRDVEMGVVGVDGTPVAVSVDGQDGPAAEMYASANITGVTDPIGIMRYASLMAPGTDPSNPATFFKHAYDTGGARAFSRWAYIQVPVLEMDARIETIAVGKDTHRIALYDDGSALVFKNEAAGVVALTELASANDFAVVAAGAPPTQFARVGRTIMLNNPIPVAGAWSVQYQPKVDTPFSCIKVNKGAAFAADGSNAIVTSDLMGEYVGYDIDSNFGLMTDVDGSTARVDQNFKLGQILDVKNGSDKDLALVLTWFRDQGLWQEQPGSATDGRNTMLSIVNAPKYVARIAVNFNQNF